MSRPRSGSPRYSRFPREGPGFHPHKVIPDQMDRSHRNREEPDGKWDYFRGQQNYPEGQRRSRSPHFTNDRHPSNQEEFYRRRQSPPVTHSSSGYDEKRGFRDDFQSFENRGRSPLSPPRVMRERLPQAPRPDTDYRQSSPDVNWRRDQDQGMGRGRFKDLSPSVRQEDQRLGAGAGRERGPNRDRHRDDSPPPQDRSGPLKRQRREMEDDNDPGFRNDSDHFGAQRYSLGAPRGGFGGGDKGSTRHSGGPLVIEHDHGLDSGREAPRWGKFEDRAEPDDPVFERQKNPRPSPASQERFRVPEGKFQGREDFKGRHLQGNWRESTYKEAGRSPPTAQQTKPNPLRFGNRGGGGGGRGGTSYRGRGRGYHARGQANRGRGGRYLPQRSQQQRSQQHSPIQTQGYQEGPREEQRQSSRPFREEWSTEDPTEAQPGWGDKDDRQKWKRERPGSLERHLPRVDLDPKMPRQRGRQWKAQNATANNNNNMNEGGEEEEEEEEETLTIKVDMSRPAIQKSSMVYSSDRQLSLDLVNVGRQRLDFLPMLEHSGTYRETAMHSGTFAQEIITLVHFVKDQYFRDEGVSLNERFSAPQKAGFSEEETEEELTLDERFSSNRGFSLNMNSLFDDEEPLFSRSEPMQPVRGPGDLRHDLERRRQERLEGVTVTISGNAHSQRPLQAHSPSALEYDDDLNEMEEEGFSNWTEEPSRRREGNNMGPRRGGASYNNNNNSHPHNNSQRRNNRFGNRLGPMRRQNVRGNQPAGHW